MGLMYISLISDEIWESLESRAVAGKIKNACQLISIKYGSGLSWLTGLYKVKYVVGCKVMGEEIYSFDSLDKLFIFIFTL